MLTIWNSKQQFCDRLTRRGFLKIGAFGASLSLAESLRLRAADTVPPRNKTAIMVYLPGGPSHTDIFDLKPDAPIEFRGEFKPIATNVPGIRICEHLPLLAKMFDKFALMRAIVPLIEEHSDSLIMTGYTSSENRTADHPSFGAVVSKLHEGDRRDMPPYVSLPYSAPIIFPRGNEPGYLGVAHRPFTPSGRASQDLSLLPAITATRLSDRRRLLGAFDNIRRDIDDSGSMAGCDAFQSKAFDMILNGKIRKALDLDQESAVSRDRYRGLESFLTARRLAEAGVGCITFSFGSWDTHGNLLPNFPTLRRQLPELDRGLANLISDLHERGLADDVVTVVWGEFGRTPKLNPGASRDHWPAVMSGLVAGGGLKMGQAIGATTARGEQPKDGRYTIPQVLSTLYRAVGIDPAQTFPNRNGRPMHILDDREPVYELL